MEINPKPVVCLIVEQESLEGKKILLQKRKKYGRYKGLWELPQGKFQVNESVFDAGFRELLEETKLEMTQIHLTHLVNKNIILESNLSYFKPLLVSIDLTLGLVGISIIVQATGSASDTNEATSHSFYPISDIRNFIESNLIFPMNVPMIKEYYEI